MSKDVLDRALGHHNAGRLSQARTLYEQVLADSPNEPDALHLLGVLSLQSGDPGTAARLIRLAIHHQDTQPDYHANLGLALSALGQSDAAIVAYKDALQLNPAHANAHYNLGSMQRSKGNLTEAIASLSRSVELNPLNLEVRANLAALHLENNDPASALSQCGACLNARPNDRLALGYKAIALQRMNEHEQAQTLLGLKHLISEQVLEVPSGFDSLTSFNQALAQHIGAHPSLVQEQPGKATRNGFQTGELLTPPKGPFASFEWLINRAVSQYLDNLPTDNTHPYLAAHPNRWRLDVWGVVLNSTGYQTAHMHPGGWVSGVYYVDLPQAINARDLDGWLEFGRPPAELGASEDFLVHQIRPEVGKLVLFPSYIFHQTVPFTSEQPRVSVAFDAIPLEFC